MGDDQPTGNFVKQGKFGRLFPKLSPLRATRDQLIALGLAMKKTDPTDPTKPVEPDEGKLPAGYTYLGQFIDHDITFDTSALGEFVTDPGAVQNFRTPKLDLDCVYGRGPVADPQLYQRANPDLLLIGRTNSQSFGKPSTPPQLLFDLPRSPEGFALIGDPRNDENLVVAQTHLAFLRFHNKLASAPRTSPVIRSVFEDTRQLVQWHYQWIVIHDFLSRVVEKAVLDNVLEHGRKYFCFEEDSDYGEPYIPVEFAAAAYRFGHSLVREEYDYNAVFRKRVDGGVTPATLELLFEFSGLSNTEAPAKFVQDIPIPSDWIIDWRRFYELGGAPVNRALKIDPFLTPKLHLLPGLFEKPKPAPAPPPPPPPPEASLPVRNLLRSIDRGLPSGQDVAAYLGLAPLSLDKLTAGPDGAVLLAQELHVKTPLFYYILKEAEQLHQGERLGPVGSRILAEVFVGLLDGDPESFRNRAPAWKPTLVKDGEFTMATLLDFVGDLNPVGDFPVPPPAPPV